MDNNVFTHFKNEETFVRSILDYKYRACEYYEIVLTDFVDLRKYEIIKTIIGKKDDLNVLSYGGINDPDYLRVIICKNTYEIDDCDFNITKVKIHYQNKFRKIRHQDVLGSLMSLGIKRELIGDIIVNDDFTGFICESAIYDYLSLHLTKVANTKVSIEAIEEEVLKKQEYKIKTFFIASFRLDVVVSNIFSVSRAKAKELILAKSVKVNNKEVEETDFLCHNSDRISLRRYGKVKIIDLDKKTKSNNHIIEGWFYK